MAAREEPVAPREDGPASTTQQEGEKLQTKHIHQIAQMPNQDEGSAAPGGTAGPSSTAQSSNSNPSSRAQGDGVPLQPPSASPTTIARSGSGAPARFPEREWFVEWKNSLNFPNIKACVSHTYNKAMHIRN